MRWPRHALVEQEGRGTSMLPVPFLRQLIRFYGDSMSAFVPSYLQLSMENLTRDQERYRTQFSHMFSGKSFPPIPFGTAAFEALQQQTRQNMAMFERALSMFSPFPGVQGQGTPDQGGVGGGGPGGQPAAASGAPANGVHAQGGSTASGKRSSEGAAAQGAGQVFTSSRELAELKAQLEAMQAKIEKMAGGKR